MPGGALSLRHGLLDTSVFIAREAGRPLGQLPETAAVSVVTLAELHLGVLMARGAAVRARRLRTLTAVQNAFEPIPIDSEVARTFAELVAEARRARKTTKDYGHLDSCYCGCARSFTLHSGRGFCGDSEGPRPSGLIGADASAFSSS